MKKMIILTMCVLSGLNLVADDTKQPYVIHRKEGIVNKGGVPFKQREEILIVSNMPTFTVSEPITNGVVYIDGKYIEPPYIVSTSNLAVLINGTVVRDLEPVIRMRETYTGIIGTTPESVAKEIDCRCEDLVRRLKSGVVDYLIDGSSRRSYGLYDGDESVLVLVELVRKATKDDEQAKQNSSREWGWKTTGQNFPPTG